MCWERATTLTADHDAPRQARSFVNSTLTDVLGDDADQVIDDVVLVTSELVANAVDARSSQVTVRLDVHHAWTTVVVQDDAPGSPALIKATEADERGRGLLIVSQLASDWGVQPVDPGKQVWARLPTDPPFGQDLFECQPPGQS
jgi:anti-sigma regulatory factor (Ser/Thr protein kinase)